MIFLKSYNRCNKNCFKKSNSKKAQATGNLIGKKIADKITSASKKLHSQNNLDETDIPKERYISPEKRQQVIDELRLV